MSFDSLLGHLERYPTREINAQWREHFALMQAAEEERRLNAECLSRAKRVGTDDDGVTTYSYGDEDCKLQAGDSVLLIDLGSGETLKGRPAIVDIDDIKQVIRLKGLKAAPASAAILKSEPIPNKALIASVGQVKTNFSAYPLIRNILERKSGIKPAQSLTEKALALEHGFIIIQGPPGTGKTYTGANLIVDLVKAKKKVGVLAQSHSAIRHLCEKVEYWAKQEGVSFRGWKAATTEKARLDTEFFSSVARDKFVKQLDCDVAAATIFQFAALPDEALDYLVVEEAGQMSLCHVIGAGRAARNLILLGDQQQLPQVSQLSHPEGAGVSILEYLLQGQAVVPESLGVFLDETRRMNEDITSLISSLCYEGKLKSHPEAAKQRLQLTDDPGDPLGPLSVFFHAIAHAGNEQRSEEEAHAIKTIVDRLKGHVPPEEIFVITPYRAQENLIRSVVGNGCRVGTVDRLQGQEGQLVIYSMAASDPESIPRDYEFLFSTNRLNVALSRAKAKAILLCSPLLLEAAPDSIEKMKLTNALCRVKQFFETALGKYRRRAPFSYVVVDIETTGLDPASGAIIEIGAVKYLGGKKLDEFQALARPRVKIEPKAFEAHGISDEYAAAHGGEPKQVLESFLAFIGESALVAHNGVGFDFPFLATECDRVGIARKGNRLLDTLPLGRKFLPTPDGSLRLQALCDAYQIVNQRAHRALEDARATGELFQHVLKKETGIDELWQLSWGLKFDDINRLPPGFDLLKTAMDGGKEILIEYQGPGKPGRERWIRPRNLAIGNDGSRVVKAICLEDNIEKHFRLDRMRKLISLR